MSWDQGLGVPGTSRGSLNAAADMDSGPSEEIGGFEDGVAHRIRGLMVRQCPLLWGARQLISRVYR